MEFKWNNFQQTLYKKFSAIGEKISQCLNRHYLANSFDFSSWKCIVETGLWCIPVPKYYGGYGFSWWDFAAAFEGLASSIKDMGFLLSLIAHVGGLRILLLEGTESQKSNYLPKLLKGAIAATAITELIGGSDIISVRTEAIKSDDVYLLSGCKAHITNAPIADIIFLVGRIPELGNKKDISLFILNKSMVGIETLSAEKMFGNKTSPTGNIILTNVKISSENIIGTTGKGLDIIYNMIALDRLLYSLIAAAFTQHILDKCLTFSEIHHTFGLPIAQNQYIQEKIVLMKSNMETSRWVTYAAIDKLINNAPDASMMCSMAKLIGSEGLIKTAQDYLQLHGHKGYMEGEISNFLADAIAMRIAGGTSEVQKINIFKQLQKLQARKNNDSI